MAARDRPDIGAEKRLALNRMGTFDWDLERSTLVFDEGGLAVFDLRPDEFDGMADSLARRVPPEECARLTTALRKALDAGQSSYGGYFQIRRRDGLRQWTHVRGHIVRNEEGAPVRVLGIVRNATTDLAEFSVVSPLEAGRQRTTTMVQGTTQALAQAVTVDDVTAVLTGAGGMERFGADGLILGLVEGSALKIVGLAGEPVAILTELALDHVDNVLPLADHSQPLAEAVLTQQPRFVASLPELAERFPRLAPYIRRRRLDAAAFLPLVAQARSIGGLGLFYRDRTEFSAEDRNLCIGLAGIVGQSLQRAILFDEERKFATDLQSSMLPRHIPDVDGAEIAVRYRTAWSGRDVGGDWYDVILLPRGRIGLVVGDVQGHDTHAAAIMGQLRIALRAYAAEGHTPSTVLARASRFLAELDTERFATCTYAQVDLGSGAVKAVRAGHLGPMVRHTDGRIGWPRLRGGLPLGLATVFGDDAYPETRLDLVPGETLVLCTDGLVEEPGLDIDVGLDALAEAVRTGPAEAEALADHVTEGMWERAKSGDDIALLVLRRNPDVGTAQAPRVHQYIHQADPEGLAEARAALRHSLEHWGLGVLADDVEVAAGELLGNVLLHTEGGAVVTLEVLLEPDRRVRLWVNDRSSVRPHRRTPGESATSGRGLMMIEAVAERWGVEPRGEGKAVWCEFVPPAAEE
ncbi:SpoIIE family protein phosphatase [Streptomyces sp. NPDC057136]|uniref:SpoIIE family protein phosphatase n=1 Tax=Streptomyces sp. NPDC057136 TaxID=3346029 RepID=UPI00363FEA88